MSAAGKSFGGLPDSYDQSENHVDQETSTEVTSSEFANTICHPIVPRRSDSSRNHGVSLSEPNQLTKPRAHPFLNTEAHDLHMGLHLDIRAQEEEGTRGREVHQQQTVEVNSSSAYHMKPPLSQRCLMSEGSTPHEIKQQASDDGASPPFMVKHLEDEDKVNQLEKKLIEAEEMYISEKQKNEALARKNGALARKNGALARKNEALEKEVVKLRQVVHKQNKCAVPRHIQIVHTDQGMDICLTALFGLFMLAV